MRIGVASDHAGFRYKTLIAEHLRRLGHTVQDFGTDSEERVDYPDKIRPLALAVARGDPELARAHNDANVLSLGQRLISEEQALALVDVWLKTPFDGGRHVARIRKLDEP
jgi:ribose 5-phosphate isomerase B